MAFPFKKLIGYQKAVTFARKNLQSVIDTDFPA